MFIIEIIDLAELRKNPVVFREMLRRALVTIATLRPYGKHNILIYDDGNFEAKDLMNLSPDKRFQFTIHNTHTSSLKSRLDHIIKSRLHGENTLYIMTIAPTPDTFTIAGALDPSTISQHHLFVY